MSKKGKWLGIIIVLLGLGLLIGGIVLSGSKPSDNPVPKDGGLKKDMKAYSQKLSNLYDSIINYATGYCGNYVLFTDKKMTVNDLSNQDIGKIVAYNLYKESKGDSQQAYIWNGTTYSKKQVDAAVKKLFGSKVKFNHEKISGCAVLKYDSSKKQYTVSANNCKYCDTIATRSKIVKSSDDKEKIVISVRVVFGQDGKYYSDYAKTNVIGSNIQSKDIDYNKGSLYNMVFKKENDNYVFSYVEPVKE